MRSAPESPAAPRSPRPRGPVVQRPTPPPVGGSVHVSRTIRVALFPLPGAILFPRSQLPLHIFEPRYREMVKDAIAGPGRIAMIQPHRLDDDNRAPLYSAGCIGALVLHGSNRVRLVREVSGDSPYRCAEVDIAAFDDEEPPPLALVQRAEVERE